MDIFGGYAIGFEEFNGAKEGSASLRTRELGSEVSFGSEAEVAKCVVRSRIEDFGAWLEPFAAELPEISFSIEGCFDASAGTMDGLISSRSNLSTETR